MTNNVFVSYAREDAQTENNLVDAFLKHGRSRERRGEISIFKDTEQINFGDEWRVKIDEALEKTDIAILMISVNFLASDFIFEHELKVLLKKHREDGVRILPVLLGECDWVSEPDLEQFQIYPDGNESLRSMNENTFDERAVEFFRTILPQNYRVEDIEQSQVKNNNLEMLNDFEKSSLENWNLFPEDVTKRSYSVEEAAEFYNVNYKDVYTYLTEKGYSKPKAFAKTPWFLTAMQFLELQSEFQLTTKLDENQMHGLFKKYHPETYQELQKIFNTFLSWGNEKLLDKNRGTIYWGQNTSGKDLGSVGWIYWKEGRKTSKYKYFLFRISGQGLISPSFWWNTQNYSNEDKKPFNDFDFQSSILEKFAKLGFSEFGANLTNNGQELASISNDNAFTKRDHFINLDKFLVENNDGQNTLNGFLEIFNEIIEEINLKIN